MRRGRELGTAAALLLAGVAHDLAAQDAAARAEVSALQDRIAQMTDRHVLEQLAQEHRPHNAACALLPSAATPRDLEYGFILERIGELSRKRSDLLRALECFSAFATSQPAWPMAWHGLGLTRLALARQSAMSRPGPLQPLGAVAIQGATAAFIRALELDSSYTDAAVQLPQAVHETLRVPIPLQGSSDGTSRLAATRRSPIWVSRARPSPRVTRQRGWSCSRPDGSGRAIQPKAGPRIGRIFRGWHRRRSWRRSTPCRMRQSIPQSSTSGTGAMPSAGMLPDRVWRSIFGDMSTRLRIS